MKNRLVILLLVLVAASLACSTSPAAKRSLDLYPSETPATTQTPVVVLVEVSTTPLPTLTPAVYVVSSTPEPSGYLCVAADEAVYLRPSPGEENYPIAPLAKGTRLIDSGSRNGVWAFVTVGEDYSGWVNTAYTDPCE